MAKQLNIDVNLNTAKAQAEIRNLQSLLTQAINGVGSGEGKLTKEIVVATEAAAKLKATLNASMNLTTGNLDLSKFSLNLAKSKMTLSDYGKQLTNLGSGGLKAFASLTKSIVNAEVPMRLSNKLLTELGTTLKNTARWQLTSSAIHAFVGGIQSAMSYARGLNESLNSIRIVTGLSAELMNLFAKVANLSAKALSASTLDYTDAALIYYQLGIRDEKEIKARTDATIKMANVTGTSAQLVSEQMTAIWNNFADGSSNLEYFSDVITALGANTASSSAEIAKGLEKFAAVADTVGLSYEYATSALATIVATTRQSEDIVGTALKTLFARIQDLELGKTLEDGTTLGKYSKALDAVGVSIKDLNGELRNMDDILADMGSKWQTLSKDQLVALALTVAGQRQYTQLVALMDHWDFMQLNLAVAYGSEGTLLKLADIYAESWEAARTRVKAAAQGIYDSLISDDFFIGFNNTLASLLNGVDKFIGLLGGIPGVLGLLGTIGMKVFHELIGLSLEKTILSFKVFTGIAKNEANAMRELAIVAAKIFTPDTGTKSLVMESKGLINSLNLANLYLKKIEEIAKSGGKISLVDQERITAMREIVDLYTEAAIAALKELEINEETAAVNMRNTEAIIQQRNLSRVSTANPNMDRLNILNLARILTEETMSSVIAYQNSYLRNLSGDEAIKRATLGKTVTLNQQEHLNEMLAWNSINARGDLFRALQLSRATVSRDTKTGRFRALTDKEKLDLLLGVIRANQAVQNADAGSAAGKELRSATIEAAKRALEARMAEDAWKLAGGKADYGDAHLKMKQALLAEARAKDLVKTYADTINKTLPESSRLAILDSLDEGLNYDLRHEKPEVANKIREDIRNLVLGDSKTQDLSDNARQMTAETERAINNLSKASFSGLTNGIMSAAMGVANLSMGLSSLKSAIDAINDDSLSFGEKFLSVTMSLGMGISMLIGGLGSIGAAVSGIGGSITGLAKATLMSAGASATDAGAKIAEASATEILNLALTRLKTILNGLKSALRSSLPMVAAIAGIVAVIAAIKKVNAEAQEATPEGLLVIAQEQATNMLAALDLTKTAADNLKASFDGYNSILDKLKNCAKGTLEWTEALRENNNEVLNLLAQYPELAGIEGAILKNADGILSISKDALDALIKKSQENIADATWAAAYASLDVIKKQLAINLKNLVKDWKDISKLGLIETLPYKDIISDFRQERLAISKELSNITKDYVGLTSIELFLKDNYWVSDEIKKGIYDNTIGPIIKTNQGALAELATIPEGLKTVSTDFTNAGKMVVNEILQSILGTKNDVDSWGTFTRNLVQMVSKDIPAALEIQNARDLLHNIEAEPSAVRTRTYDALAMSLTAGLGESYLERRMGGTAGFLDEVSSAKSKGLNIIASHWGELMALSAEEMGPVLDKIFTGSGISMKDSAAWAKELTTNHDLRKALNQNATALMSASATLAAVEATAINEKLLSEGYSSADAAVLSKVLGSSGELSSVTAKEQSKLLSLLKGKGGYRNKLWEEYVESKGGLAASITKTEGGISFLDAEGNEYTATNEMMASALAAAHALDTLGASASGVADVLNNIDTTTPEGEAMLEYLLNKSFLGMKPEEIAKFGNGITSAKDMEKFFKENGITEDNVKELLGVDSISDAAQEAYNTLKFNLEGLVEALLGITDEERALLEGLRNYRKMTAADLIDYINKHFNKDTFELPDLDAPVESYESLSTKVDTIREKWDAVGNSILNGTHVTSDMEALFSELGMNLGDLGEYIDGDLITDAEGLKQALDEATGSTSDLIEHAKLMDMITYDNLTNDLLKLVDTENFVTSEFSTDIDNILSLLDGLELSMARYQLLQESLSGSTSLFSMYEKGKAADEAADWTNEWTSAFKDFYENVTTTHNKNTEAWDIGKLIFLPENMQDASFAETQKYLLGLANLGFYNLKNGEASIDLSNLINFVNAGIKAGVFKQNELTGGYDLGVDIKSTADIAKAFGKNGIDMSANFASVMFSAVAQNLEGGDILWSEMAEHAGDYGTQILTTEGKIKDAAEEMQEAIKNNDFESWKKASDNMKDLTKTLDSQKDETMNKVDKILGKKSEIEEKLKQIEELKQTYDTLLAEVDAGTRSNTDADYVMTKAAYENSMQQLFDLEGELTNIGELSDIEVKIYLEKMYTEKLMPLKKLLQEIRTASVEDYSGGDSSFKGKVKGFALRAKKAAEVTTEIRQVEEKIKATVDATDATKAYADIVANYEDAKSNIENNEAEIKANPEPALREIRKATNAALNYARGHYNAVLTASSSGVDSAIAAAKSKIISFVAWAAAQTVRFTVSTLFGGGSFAGSARVLGSAFDSGSWGLKSALQNALVGELGQELIVDPNTGMYYTVGDSGAEFVNIPKGAIIFNHKLTESLLRNRHINTRGQALISGSAFSTSPFDTGAAPSGGGNNAGGNGNKGGNNAGGKGNNNPGGKAGGKKGGAAAAAGADITYEQELLTIIREETNAYRNLETAVKKLNQTYEFIARNNDRLWGRDVLVNMEKSIQALNEVYKKQRQIQDMRTKDYQASIGRFASTNELQYTKKVAAAGSTADSPKWNTLLVTFDNFNAVQFLLNLGFLKNNPFTMDTNGNYKDFDAVAFEQANAEYMRAYELRYNAAVAAAKTEADIVAAENELSNAKAIFDLNKTFLSESDKALEDMNQAINDAQDSLEEMHDLAALKITKRLEMRIDLSEGELKIIDSRMKSMGDSIYKMAESMTMLWNGDPQSANDKYSHIVEKAFSYSEAYDEALKGLAIALKNYLDPHAITSEKFIEIAKEARDGILEQVDALLELKEAYAEYYGNVLSKATEELEKYTNQMEHQASVLEHLKNLMDLTGRKYDYKGQETIIRGLLEMAKDAYEVAKHWEMTTKENMEAALKSYEELLLTDALGAKNYKNEVLDKAVEYFNEAEEKMLASAEDYLLNYENLWLNTLDSVRDKWDKLATDGMGWDALLDSMDRAKSIQDEYLTTTNKLYETNTLLRKVNKDINSTDSMISKEKLNDFAKMVEARLKDNKLTQSGMEILKAKYELLQAELALEEMKDAKDTVRLQRDSEGNYGYVYTADQEKIEEAEQNFADKLNDLYNLVLGYSNDYREKYILSLKEYEDKVMAIYENDALTEEERQKQLNELKQQYSDLWHAYDLTLQEAGLELNRVAAEGISEAWATLYDDRIAKLSEFLDVSNEAEATLLNIMKEITEAHEDMTNDAKLGLNDVEKKTKDVTTANHLLAEQLHTEIIPNVDKAIDYAEILTKQWESQALMVDKLIKKYQKLAEAIQNTMQEKADYLGNHEGDLSEAIWDEYVRTGKFNSDLLEERSAKVRENNMTLDLYVWSNAELKKIMTTYTNNNMGYNSWSELGLAYVLAGRNLEAVIQAYEEQKKILSSTGITTEVGKLLSGYATGGYTGEWGPEGKLAMLHEKELVLNATDTANMLDTIEALREMTRSMNLRSMISGMVDMIASPAFLNSLNNTLQQEVHITAEFPNATNHNEIEQAFTNLVNRASQYANRSNWKNSTDTLVESSVFD